MGKDPEKAEKAALTVHASGPDCFSRVCVCVYVWVCGCARERSSPLYDRYVSTEQWLLCECDFQIFCITHTIRFLKNTLCLQRMHISQRTSEARGRAHTHAGTHSHIKSKAKCSYFCRVLGRILFRAAFWLNWRDGKRLAEKSVWAWSTAGHETVISRG